MNRGSTGMCAKPPPLHSTDPQQPTVARSNLYFKFADDTTVVGLINNGDETNYWSEVSRLACCYKDNNLLLDVEKTKEMVVDFRRAYAQLAPLIINNATVERVKSTKFQCILYIQYSVYIVLYIYSRTVYTIVHYTVHCSIYSLLETDFTVLTTSFHGLFVKRIYPRKEFC